MLRPGGGGTLRPYRRTIVAMKSLLGLLLIFVGIILAIPQIYEVLAYIDYNRWPLIQGVLGITCIAAGLALILRRSSRPKRVLTEV